MKNNQRLDDTIITVENLPDIKGFQQTTLLDWDGAIASIIFLGGCNFRCNFCHARELVLNPQALDSICFNDIDAFLRSKTGWIDGVVITGGEPTIYGSKLVNLIRLLKDMGLAVKLDTNGTNPGILTELLDNGLVDYIAMDIKAPLERAYYRNVAGVDVNIEAVIMSKDIIIRSNIGYEFRTTIIPNIISIAAIEEIARSLMPAKKYRLQQFRPKDTLDPSFLNKQSCPKESIEAMTEAAQAYIPDTKFRG